ncbi:MAG: hypothetical protein PF569_09690 [Candidatus Woesearchaeota archaeon]|nr:hypothetical protein [Candidatus Woesearchaeota archaeon]
MKFNKSQITVVESSFILLLFLGTIVFLVVKPSLSSELNYQKNVDTIADSIYYSETFRDIIMLEDLTTDTKSEDWSKFELVLNSSISDYDFSISNGTLSESLYSCDGDFKDFAERVISIENNTVSEFRTFRIGVCY